MKKYKSLWLLLAAVIMLFVLTACKSENTVLELENPDTQPEYLSFFSYTNISGSDVTKYWSEHFMQTYEKEVYINFDGAAYYADEGLSYRELLEKRLQSSAPDDLYIINAEDVIEFEQKGYWMDLSDMSFVQNLSEAALYQSTYNGKVFSVPLSFTGYGFVWNVDLLKEHGLTIPQNREEFLNVCEKLKNEGITPYGANKGYALTVPIMCAGFSDLYGSEDQEERIAALDSGETPVSDYLRKGFEFLSLMIEKGYLDPQQALESTPSVEDIEMLMAGECAFICCHMGCLYDVPKDAFHMEMTGLPLLENGSIAVYGANSRLCVNPESKHLDTVLEFIEMVGSPEALGESAAWDYAMSSAKNGGTAGLTTADQLVELLQQPGQIPNQDFALHFNTWENIRNVGREICSGISVEQACTMIDELQKQELEVYGDK